MSITNKLNILRIISVLAKSITFAIILLIVILLASGFGYPPIKAFIGEVGCIDRETSFIASYVAIPVFFAYFVEAYYTNHMGAENHYIAFKKMICSTNQSELGRALGELTRVVFAIHVLLYTILRC